MAPGDNIDCIYGPPVMRKEVPVMFQHVCFFSLDAIIDGYVSYKYMHLYFDIFTYIHMLLIHTDAYYHVR